MLPAFGTAAHCAATESADSPARTIPHAGDPPPHCGGADSLAHEVWVTEFEPSSRIPSHRR